MDVPMIAIAEIKGDVAGLQEVMSKIVLDILLTVTRADDKLVVTIMKICFHDVPKNWLAIYLNHGFGTALGFFADASTKATG